LEIVYKGSDLSRIDRSNCKDTRLGREIDLKLNIVH
jgi:hypothetical protein